jgi:hypothetical protein
VGANGDDAGSARGDRERPLNEAHAFAVYVYPLDTGYDRVRGMGRAW